MRIALALLVLTFLPGIPLAALFVRQMRHGVSWLAISGTLGILWSVFATLGLTVAHLPLSTPWVGIVSSVPALTVFFQPSFRRTVLRTLRGVSFAPWTTLLVAATVVVLALPLRTVQQDLPTGDVQKSIFWGQRILETKKLPTYREALRFNRDPVDFATPGLHALTAAVIALSGDPFRGPAWFSFVAGILLAGLASALAAQLSSFNPQLSTLAFVFAATNIRFLRYVLAPGYHYQNLIGELLFLLAFLFLIQAVGGRAGTHLVALAGLSAVTLPLVHQFTAFLALLTLPVVFAFLAVKYRREVSSILATLPPAKRRVLFIVAGIVILAAFEGFARGPLLEKLPQLFTVTPHLQAYVIHLSAIPFLLGVPFFLLGAVGSFIAVVSMLRRELEWRWVLLLLWVGLLLALSQGARWVIDIPSARTLFYVATPLAALAALAAFSAVERIAALWPRAKHLLVPVALSLLLAPTAGASLNTRLQNIDHGLQTNSTLTRPTLELIEWLSKNPPRCESKAAAPCADAILVDDWNQRRTTWALLSSYRMLTRVGSDLAVIAREAGQSDQRRTQYEALLDFEKIYSLGNSPVISPLLERHGIALLVGVNNLSRDVFANNPALKIVYQNEEVTVFAQRREQTQGQHANATAAEDIQHLLDRTTLANDVGDAEDVFARLPVSVLAPQISAAQQTPEMTFREIQSAVSSIGLNVGSYVPNLWDANGDRVLDAPVELMIRAVGNGALGRITRGNTVFLKFALPADEKTHVLRARIPKGALPIDEQGLAFVALRLDKGPLRVDLVAARFVRQDPP